MFVFRWNDWNLEHATVHGVSTFEVEWIVRSAKPPYPQQRGNGKWFVWGQSPSGSFIQVVYVIDPDDTLYVIHARALSEPEKKRFRRKRRWKT